LGEGKSLPPKKRCDFCKGIWQEIDKRVINKLQGNLVWKLARVIKILQTFGGTKSLPHIEIKKLAIEFWGDEKLFPQEIINLQGKWGRKSF